MKFIKRIICFLLFLLMPFGTFSGKNVNAGNIVSAKSSLRMARNADLLEKDDRFSTDSNDEASPADLLKKSIAEMQYEKSLTDDESKKEKLDVLIQTQQKMVFQLENEKSSLVRRSFANRYSVAFVTSLFVAANARLSAELLTKAASIDKDFDEKHTAYEPVYGGEVYNSPEIIDLLLGRKKQDNFVFTFDTSNIDSSFGHIIDTFTKLKDNLDFDLYCALHGVTIKNQDTINKRLDIFDQYDFIKDSFSGVIGDVVNSMVDAHDAGEIHWFPLVVHTHYADYINVTDIKYDSNHRQWNYTIKNDHDSTETYIYNRKLAHYDDCRQWKNLTDLDAFALKSGEEKTVTVDENGDAEHFAVSFTSYWTRYIMDVFYSSIFDKYFREVSIVSCPWTNGYRNFSHTGTEWIIGIENSTDLPISITYNRKMCNYDDAMNWENLYDLETKALPAHEWLIIKVSENYFATTIAVKKVTSESETRIAIDGLDSSGNMKVHTTNLPVNNYIEMQIVSKSSGNWRIKLTNNTAEQREVFYNRKMCNLSDGRNWKNLNDVSSVVISAHDYSDVTISENWFASTIAASYVENGKRMITYADHLDSSRKTMNLYHNII